MGAIWVSAIFQNCRNENLIWTISLVLIYMESCFWCLYLCFHGQETNETTYKEIGSFLYCEFEKIQDGCQQK